MGLLRSGRFASEIARRRARSLEFCVVGSGPAGFYSTEALLRELPNCQVHIIERLPVPFGLVRFGVAPDHPEAKSVQTKFTSVAENPRVKFWGNVAVGKDVSVDDLKRRCDGVVLAYGASEERKLNIPGEESIVGVHSARDFVAWYNGHPDYSDAEFNLEESESVTVIGNGNVSMDVSRILLKSPDELWKTDISEQAIEKLSRSRVKHVHVVGRRGVAQAAWTGKELRELLNLPGVRNNIRPKEVTLDPQDVSELKLSRVKKRCTDLIMKELQRGKESSGGAGASSLDIRFLLSPLAFHSDRGSEAMRKLSSVLFQRMHLSGDAGSRQPNPLQPGAVEKIDCQLAFRSLGYRGRPMAGVPFDDRRGVIPSENGLVSDGVYVTGWIKRGPSGVIGSNRWDAEETVLAMIEAIADTGDHSRDRELEHYLQDQFGAQAVDTVGWKRILALEDRNGSKVGKKSSKFRSVQDMLAVARNQ